MKFLRPTRLSCVRVHESGAKLMIRSHTRLPLGPDWGHCGGLFRVCLLVMSQRQLIAKQADNLNQVRAAHLSHLIIAACYLSCWPLISRN